MKIVQIVSGLGNGGAEKLIVELCNEMVKDHEVFLISFRDVEDWMIFPKLLSRKVILLSLGKKSGFQPWLLGKLFISFLRIQPDIVNIHLDSTLWYTKKLIWLFPSIKFFYTIHSNLQAHKERFDSFNKKKVKISSFICISPLIYNEFMARYNSLNFSLIENGLSCIKYSNQTNMVRNEVELLKHDINTKVFITVGRIAPAKNYSLLLKVIKKISYHNIILLVIGDDTVEGKPLKKQLLKQKCNNVFFLGPRKDVVNYLIASDVFILSSTHEGMPITVLEAMSVGLPIICTPAGGLVDMIKPDINGFIAKGFSEADLLLQAENFFKSSEKNLKKIKDQNIKDISEKYSIQKCSQKYIEVYKSSMNS